MRPTIPRIFGTVLALILFVAIPSAVSATWSVIALDARTGRIVVTSATCVAQSRLLAFPAKGLMDVQTSWCRASVWLAAQAGVDQTRANQTLLYQQLKEGTAPRLILDMLRADPDIEHRQFGIVDLQGRSIGFSGSGNHAASQSAQGRVSGTDIYYSIQGNILASDAVAKNPASALTLADGDVIEKVMGADAAGGDRRRTLNRAGPGPPLVTDGTPTSRTSS